MQDFIQLFLREGFYTSLVVKMSTCSRGMSPSGMKMKLFYITNYFND